MIGYPYTYNNFEGVIENKKFNWNTELKNRKWRRFFNRIKFSRITKETVQIQKFTSILTVANAPFDLFVFRPDSDSFPFKSESVPYWILSTICALVAAYLVRKEQKRLKGWFQQQKKLVRLFLILLLLGGSLHFLYILGLVIQSDSLGIILRGLFAILMNFIEKIKQLLESLRTTKSISENAVESFSGSNAKFVIPKDFICTIVAISMITCITIHKLRKMYSEEEQVKYFLEVFYEASNELPKRPSLVNLIL